MRTMEIPPFPRKIEILDLNNLLTTRLSQTIVIWPEQAIPLLGYMCCPNDPPARDSLTRTLRSWPQASEGVPPIVPDKLSRIQNDWLRVADVIHTQYDLVEGQHQARRGGPSIGKAITLVDANAKSCGTGAATLWKTWSTYKDVAHLVAAATLTAAEARTRFRNKPFEPFGLWFDQFIPFQMAMLMPDLVLAVGLEFERVGLSAVPHGAHSQYWIPQRCGEYRQTSMSRRCCRRPGRSGRKTWLFSTTAGPAIAVKPTSPRLVVPENHIRAE
jgi:hypothetical protein